MQRFKLKKSLYNICAKGGIFLLNKIFPEFFAKEPLSPSDRYLEYPFVISNLPSKPATILDVGCSGSFFPLILHSLGYKVYGIDIRPYPILNKLHYGNFKFFKADISNAHFESDFFDAITAISSIEHFGIPGRYGVSQDAIDLDLKAVKEMRRILKNKGVLLLTIPVGKAKIIKPFTRIYDNERLKQLTDKFAVEKEEYYMQDKEINWFKCAKMEAMSFNASCENYSVCLLKLRKLSAI